jgi:hypothetical protein
MAPDDNLSRAPADVVELEAQRNEAPWQRAARSLFEPPGCGIAARDRLHVDKSSSRN